jgi:uncharacterized membrane protein
MKGTLIVITFDQPDRAGTVFEALNLMRRRALYSLDEALVVTRNRQGQVRLHHTHTLANTQSPHTLDVLVGLLFAKEDEDGENGHYAQTDIKTNLSAAGFDLKFLEIIGTSMQEESSALFFLVKKASLGDADEIIKVLSLFHGRISQTTITPASEAYLTQLAY